MFQFPRWLSLYWFVLLPISSLVAAGFHYRAQRRRWQNELSFRKALRWLLMVLAASQVYIGLLITNSFYETSLWLAGGALLAVLVMAVAKRCASISIHPGLQRSLLEVSGNASNMIEDETRVGQWSRRIVRAVRTVIPFLPGVAIIVYVLVQQVARWPGLWLIMIAILCPLLVTLRQKRHMWLMPLSLTLIALAFGWQALQLRQSLPPGYWITPMTSASCSSTVQLDLERKYAWCADENSGWVYQFMPKTGIVGQGLFVDHGAQAFAGNSKQVWVMQNPVRGLVLVENGQQTQIKINLARKGAVDRKGRLWVIDVIGTLWVRDPNGEWKRLKVSDGLLDNTANVVKTSPDGSVWVGSIGGVSRLVAGTTVWQVILRSDVLPGLVQDFAFTADGKVWYLWEAASAYQDRVRWGVSSWQRSRWSHIELGAGTGLDYPPSNHAFSIDGQGRVWFVAPSYIQKANFLGILEPHSGVISLYYLGPFDISPGGGFSIPGFNGVIDDGSGGIFLYNPGFSPLRHWRLDQEQNIYQPCVQPCEVADIMYFFHDGLVVESSTSDDIFRNPKEDRTKLFLSQILQH